jgi:signal transduction histidine kinase
MTAAGPDRQAGDRRVDADRLCAVLGHELRNPLAAALTGLAVVAEMTDETDPRRAFLARAELDLRRVGALLEGWLELSRRSHTSAASESGSVDVSTSVCSVAREVANRTGAALEMESGAGADWFVTGRAVLLERALENLVVNARGAGARNVRLRVRGGGRDEVVVEVDDDGRGVPEELRRDGRLFEAFVSGGAGSTKGSGAGLGLAIVRDVVAAFGGRIELVERPGPGSRFRATLPCRAGDDATTSTTTSQRREDPPFSAPTAFA